MNCKNKKKIKTFQVLALILLIIAIIPQVGLLFLPKEFSARSIFWVWDSVLGIAIKGLKYETDACPKPLFKFSNVFAYLNNEIKIDKVSVNVKQCNLDILGHKLKKVLNSIHFEPKKNQLISILSSKINQNFQIHGIKAIKSNFGWWQLNFKVKIPQNAEVSIKCPQLAPQKGECSIHGHWKNVATLPNIDKKNFEFSKGKLEFNLNANWKQREKIKVKTRTKLHLTNYAIKNGISSLLLLGKHPPNLSPVIFTTEAITDTWKEQLEKWKYKLKISISKTIPSPYLIPSIF